jgi:hypothetical protein
MLVEKDATHAHRIADYSDPGAIGSAAAWPYSHAWGYYPSGGLGILLIIVVILLLL